MWPNSHRNHLENFSNRSGGLNGGFGTYLVMSDLVPISSASRNFQRGGVGFNPYSFDIPHMNDSCEGPSGSDFGRSSVSSVIEKSVTHQLSRLFPSPSQIPSGLEPHPNPNTVLGCGSRPDGIDSPGLGGGGSK